MNRFSKVLLSFAVMSSIFGVTKKQTTVVKAEEGIPMFRLYNPNSGEHFYTSSSVERNTIAEAGWTYEGVGWDAPATSNTPVFRMYNENGGEHHYTMSADERDYLVSAGWNYEGVGWYSDDEKKVPVYRQYNPNAFACNHNYTVSKTENDWLAGLGWKEEGIGWYASGEGTPVAIEVESVAISKPTLYVSVTRTGKLTASVSPSFATDQTIIWKTSNPKIATVSDGIVYGVSVGTTTITAESSNGKTASCTVIIISHILA